MDPTIATLPATALSVPVTQPALAVVVRSGTEGIALAREVVRPEDLTDHISEAWRDGCLRKGRPDIPAAGLQMRLKPQFRDARGPLATGFTLEFSLPDGRTMAIDFTLASLSFVACRAARRLLAAGKLQPAEEYFYEAQYQPDATPAFPGRKAKEAIEFDVTDRSPGLTWLEVPLRALLQNATPQSALDEEAFHVFFTAAALAQAEHCARQGATASSPVETGAVLVGALCSCPDTGDAFVVVTDAYEVTDAEQRVFSLTYTGRSWKRIQTILRARQVKCPALRLLGQVHGHNFLPGGGKTCQACPTRPVCDLTNLYASEDDQTWTRAIFSGAPYSLCGIFGLSARGDRVQALFTQRDARLRPRGYCVIPDFKSDQWECRDAVPR